MWDLPGPGLEPMSPTLAGGFLTTAPATKEVLVSDFLNHMKIIACDPHPGPGHLTNIVGAQLQKKKLNNSRLLLRFLILYAS